MMYVRNQKPTEENMEKGGIETYYYLISHTNLLFLYYTIKK